MISSWMLYLITLLKKFRQASEISLEWLLFAATVLLWWRYWKRSKVRWLYGWLLRIFLLWKTLSTVSDVFWSRFPFPFFEPLLLHPLSINVSMRICTHLREYLSISDTSRYLCLSSRFIAVDHVLWGLLLTRTCFASNYVAWSLVNLRRVNKSTKLSAPYDEKGDRSSLSLGTPLKPNGKCFGTWRILSDAGQIARAATCAPFVFSVFCWILQERQRFWKHLLFGRIDMGAEWRPALSVRCRMVKRKL